MTKPASKSNKTRRYSGRSTKNGKGQNPSDTGSRLDRAKGISKIAAISVTAQHTARIRAIRE
jgi:hypothetical protein